MLLASFIRATPIANADGSDLQLRSINDIPGRVQPWLEVKREAIADALADANEQARWGRSVSGSSGNVG